MVVRGLQAPTNLTIDFKPSPRQYEMWKLLQPNSCPHCGGEIETVMVELDEKGKPKYSPQCKKCGSRHLPRFILGGGAAGGGKSYVGSCWIIISCLRFPDTRAVVARKTLKALKGSTFNTIKYVLRTWGLEQDKHYKINNLEGLVIFYNGSTISLIELEDLPSDPEFERLGSNEWSCGFIDECSQVSEKAVEILYSRLRWRVSEDWGYARLLMTTNPSMNWVRSRFVQDDDGNRVVLAPQDAYVQFGVFDNPNEAFVATYRDALDKLSDEAARHRLLYGVWDWVGTNEAAAYWNFDGKVHLVDNLKEKVYDPMKPLVLSFDFNVVPFMSCVVMQIDYSTKHLYILEEILGRPEEKENNTPKFADKINSKFLTERHMGGIVITGDPAGTARSTQTEDGVNNFTIIRERLNASLRATCKLLSKQPPQSARLDFINRLLAGEIKWTVRIDMRCRRLTEDLIYQKKNEDGTKDKTKVTDPKLGVRYEKYGHLSDCVDYGICVLLSQPWKRYIRGSSSGISTVKDQPVYGMFNY
jgi:phage terminase large subunit